MCLIKGRIASLIGGLNNSRLAKDSFWAIGGSVVSKAFGLFSGIIVARLLGRDLFGEFGLIKNIFLYIAVFSTFGLGFTATRFLAISRENNDRLRTASIINQVSLITLIFSGVMGIMFTIFSGWLSDFLELGNARHLFVWLGIIIVLNAFATSQTSMLCGLGLYRVTAINSLYYGIASFCFSVTLTYFYGFDGAIISILASNLVWCALNSISLRKAVPGRGRLGFDRPVLKELLGFSAPVALQECSISVLFMLSPILLVKLSDYGQMGLFSASGQWSALIAFIPHSLQNVALTHLSGASANSAERHNHVFARLVRVNLASSAIPAVTISAFAWWIASFYGASFTGLPWVIALGCLAAIPTSVLTLYFQDFLAMGKNWTIFGIRFGRDTLQFALVALLVYSYASHGAIAYITASMLANILCLLSLYALKRRYCLKART